MKCVSGRDIRIFEYGRPVKGNGHTNDAKLVFVAARGGRLYRRVPRGATALMRIMNMDVVLLIH